MIPLSRPDIGEKEILAVEEVLRSGWLTYGPKNEEFEERFASYIGTKYAVSLNSCTSALFLALKALGIKGEVILPSFTFVASANAVVTAGAKPVFVDIEYNSCNIDPAKIREKITPQTEAIMPVHFGGQSANMDEIMKIAKKYSLAVIEDAAETIGGTYKGKMAGSFGIGCFSFFPTKNMTTGEGGMLTTNDREIAEKVKALSSHGISSHTFEREKEPWIRDAVFAGYNFRMSNILAAIGVEQIKRLDEMNKKRRRHAEYLNSHLLNEFLDLPFEEKHCQHVYQMYTVKLKEIERSEFISRLRKKGIGASVHFDPPVHNQTYYKRYGYSKDSLPVTEKVAKSIVTLPMFPQMKQEDLDQMVSVINNLLRELSS